MTDNKIKISEKLSMLVDNTDSISVVYLDGEMAPDDTKLYDTLLEIISNNKKVILDMTKVKYMNSACIGLLIRLLKKSRENDGDIAMCSLNVYLQKICRIVALDKVFKIFETIEDAKSHFESA